MHIHLQRNDMDPSHIPHKNELKIDHRPKCLLKSNLRVVRVARSIKKAKSIKLLEENTGLNLYDLW